MTPFAHHLLTLEARIYTSLRALADRRAAKSAQQRNTRPKPAHLLTGERGEAAAYFHLRSLAYTITARRWQNARLRGDLDLIAWDGDTLVLIEVKTRTARDLAPAELQVDTAKRNHLRQQATVYLRRIPESHRDSVPVRFDILAVYLLPTGNEFDHYPNAFPRSAPPADQPRKY